jgi:DNA ligase 1
MIVMNTPASIFAAIEAIAADSTKAGKEAGVKAVLGVPLGRKILVAAYDSFVNYGIGKGSVPKKTPGLAPGSNSLSEPCWWETLDRLASRDLSGAAARLAVAGAIDFLDEPSAELFRRILMKDMRAGFTDGTMNRVEKGILPEFPYMRCTLPKKSNIDKWDWSVGIIAQEKADGMFTNMNLDATGAVWATTRQGSPIPLEELPELEAAVRTHLIPGTQSHGELLVFQDGKLMPREEGNGVLNHIASGGAPAANQRVEFHVWDQIPLEAVKPKGKHATPAKQRLAALIKALQAGKTANPAAPIALVRTIVVKSKAQAWAFYRELLKLGREGAILKHPDSGWMDTNSGNKDIVKLKLEVPVELECIGGNLGSGKNEGKISSLIMRTRDDKLIVNVTCRGDAMIAAATANIDKFKAAIHTVKANSIMEPENEGDPYSLFLPVYIEERTDKSEADDLDGVREQFQNAVEAA